MLQKLFTIAVSLFWGWVYSLKALVDLVRVGPSQYFHTTKDAPMPEELQNEKYGDHRMINLGTVKLHYVISGPEDAPLMLMLHGFPEVWYSWKHQIMEFKKDFRVVAVDMRGYGDSDKPQGLDKYKGDVLVEDIRLLIEGLGYKSCVLMAHDWGGAVGWAFASRHPAMVDRYVACNICPAPMWWGGIWSTIRQFICSGYIFFFFLPYVPEFLMSRMDCKIFDMMFNDKLTGMKARKMSEEELGCYKYYYRRPGAFTGGINYYRSNLGPPHRPFVEHPLVFPMPIHIVWGTGDPFLSLKLLEDTLKAVPHASVTRLEDCSHWVQNDRPDTVNQAIRDFLKFSKFEFTARK